MNLFIVFLISGLWHGASWNFVIWGALHGSFIVLAIQRDKIFSLLNPTIHLQKTLLKYFNILFTFSLVTLAWVFFRSNSIGTSVEVFKKLSSFSFDDKITIALNSAELGFSFLLILFLMLKEKIFFQFEIKSDFTFWILTGLMVTGIYFFGVFSLNQFIYFQF